MPGILRIRPWRLALPLLCASCARAPSVSGAEMRRIEKVDIHTHYFADRDFLAPVLDGWRMRAVSLNITSSYLFPGDSTTGRWLKLRALRAAHPGLLLLAATFEPACIDSPRCVPRALRDLASAIDDGAIMVKVWKDIGMTVRDSAGRYVQIDDPRFQPIWDLLVQRHIPVIAHLADPALGWMPLRRGTPYYDFYSRNAQFYPYAHPDWPRWEAIMAARERWLVRNPDLVVIGAHLASEADSLTRLEAELAAHPNLYVETSARVGELRTQPVDRVRRFFLSHQDRILYGSDLNTKRSADSLDSRRLSAERARLEETYADDWRYFARELQLPDSVLVRLYERNALRLLRIAARGDSTAPTPR
jgi:hypothetical protein